LNSLESELRELETRKENITTPNNWNEKGIQIKKKNLQNERHLLYYRITAIPVIFSLKPLSLSVVQREWSRVHRTRQPESCSVYRLKLLCNSHLTHPSAHATRVD